MTGTAPPAKSERNRERERGRGRRGAVVEGERKSWNGTVNRLALIPRTRGDQREPVRRPWKLGKARPWS